MAETTYRDVVVRLALKQAEAKVKPPDMRPAKKAVVDFDKVVQAANKRMEESYKSVDESIEKVNKSIEEITDARKAAAEAVDASIKVGDSMEQFGKAAIQAAKGMALLTAANEDDLKVMMKTIVQAQGMFDVLSGGWDVLKAGKQAYTALTTATQSAAVASKALQFATGPVGLAVAGVTAAVSAAILIYKKWAREAEESAARQERAIQGVINKTKQLRGERISKTEMKIEAFAERRRYGRVSAAEEEQFRKSLAKEASPLEGILGHEKELIQIERGRVASFEADLARARALEGEAAVREQQRIAADPTKEREIAREFNEWREVNRETQQQLIDAILESKREIRDLRYQLDNV